MFTSKTLALGAALGCALTVPAALTAQEAATETSEAGLSTGISAEAETDLSATIEDGDVKDAAEETAESVGDAVEDAGDAVADGVEGAMNAADDAVDSMAAETDAATELDTGMTVQGEASILANVEDPNALIGVRVYDENEEWVGEVDSVAAATASEEGEVIVDVGGFLGLGEKPVAVAESDFSVSYDEDGDLDYLIVSLTMEELEAMPEADTQM
ncbi:hypothetical protein [Celeribacter sp.]|uniref:hypothetical protein n=1 Tax=Celeribacter sp. TaxID=1890673 RepID=UPI003A8CC60D